MSCQSELFKTAWREEKEEEEARKSRQVDSRVNKHHTSVLLPETNSVLWWPFRFVSQKTIQRGAFYTFQSLIVFSLKCFLLNWHLCVVWNLPSSSPGGRHETLQLQMVESRRRTCWYHLNAPKAQTFSSHHENALISGAETAVIFPMIHLCRPEGLTFLKVSEDVYSSSVTVWVVRFCFFRAARRIFSPKREFNILTCSRSGSVLCGIRLN